MTSTHTTTADHLATRAAHAFMDNVEARIAAGFSPTAAFADTLDTFGAEYPALADLMAGALLRWTDKQEV